MNEKHRVILRSHWSSLSNHLEIEELLPCLVDVLGPADEEKVKAGATRRDRIDKLLEILPRKGPAAFHNFLKALQKIQPFLAAPLIQESGVSASHLQEKASKRIIFADIVAGEGSSWILKETGVCITFSPKAVPDPKLVTASLWRPSTVSPPLEENEMLVSNVIELACDDPVGITFSGVTVALSHSATDLRGYELVMKELTNTDDNVWKDLETWCPSDPLSGNSESQSELRFAQAKITSFSMYAVTCRLKSYTFSSSISENSPEYTCTCPEYPDVSVTIPTRSLPLTEDFTLTMKVEEVPNDDYEEEGVFLGPILHISCSLDVELQEPALIRIPITLQQDQIKLLDLSPSHIRIFYYSTKDELQEWVEITSQLETPAEIENGVVTFQVNHFCKFWVICGVGGEQHLVPHPSKPQPAGFLAWLCDTGNPEEYLLVLCCFPIHLKSVVQKEIASKYTVAHQGDGTSLKPLTKDDEVFLSLPDELTPRGHMKNTFLRFLGHASFLKSFPVYVKKTGTHLIEFFKQKKGKKDRKETLCTMSIIPASPLQVLYSVKKERELDQRDKSGSKKRESLLENYRKINQTSVDDINYQKPCRTQLLQFTDQAF